MSRRAQENIVAGLLLGIFAGYMIMCLEFGPNARLVPLPMSILGFILVATQIIRQNLGSPEGRPFGLYDLLRGASLTGEADVDKAVTPDIETEQDSQRELLAFGCVVIFVCLITLLGPIVAVFLFVSGYLFFSRHSEIGKAIVVASVFTMMIYLLFVVGLQLQLYHGILEPLIDRY